MGTWSSEKQLYKSQFLLAPSQEIDESKRRRRRQASPFFSRIPSSPAWTVVKLVVACAAMYYMVVGLRRAWLSTRADCNHIRKLHVQVPPAYYTLPSGDRIPTVALGTWQAPKGEVGQAVTAALAAGYRHIDGAWAYQNEEEIGLALSKSTVPRSSLFLTSKLWNSFHHPGDIEPVLDETLDKLRTSYLDLYLIHWPVAFKKEYGSDGRPIVDWKLTDNILPTWRKLEEMVQKGKIKNIGVSNFNIRRLRNLTESDIRIRPAVNQVELNYWNPQPELIQYCKDNDILVEAYSPLGSDQVKETLELPIIQDLSKELSITPAQLLISWHVQRGTVVLPKSVTPARVRENLHIFTLPTHIFEKLEQSAVSHPPRRVVDPSKRWGIDVFEDAYGQQ